MARPPVFRVSAIGDLFSQLRFAPTETRLRQMDNAERLAAEIDPAKAYPRDYVVFRVTGYREQRTTEPEVLAGLALIGDLAAFIERLSRSVDLSAAHEHRRAIPVSDLPARLRVSERTIKRYRRQGLICHHVRLNNNTTILACFEDALQRFLATHGEQVQRAGSFTRVDREVERRIIEEAMEMRVAQRVSLNQVARVLARKYQRAHETIRGILRRHDRSAEEPIFTDRGPLTPRERSVICRAWRWGIEPARLTERFGRKATTIQRAINDDRTNFLRNLRLSHVPLPTFEMDDADQVILSVSAVTAGLHESLPLEHAGSFVEWAKRDGRCSVADEDALIAAYNLLKRRAVLHLGRMNTPLTAGLIDGIETDLRWAGLLKRRLMVGSFRTALVAIERTLHKPLMTQPTEVVLSMLRQARDVISRVIETINPSEGQTLQRMCGFAMDRTLATVQVLESRAIARHESSAMPVVDLFDVIVPWEQRLGLRRSWAERIEVLTDESGGVNRSLRELVERRYGLTGEPPQTLNSLAARFDLTPTHVARRLRRAMKHLREATRTANGESGR